MDEDRPSRVIGKVTELTDDGARPERFTMVREIGRGGMGRVSEAFDHRLHRIVAVKTSIGTDADLRARFEREVAITARLEHPSIIPLYDAGTSETGEPFYVMRRVSGRPLDVLLRERPSLGGRLTLLPHLLAVADAVAHAHQRGIIHRDLKPSNVIVGELGETVVIDWGLAKVVAEAEATFDAPLPDHALGSTKLGRAIGTPGFMSPEQTRGLPVDPRADVFALGAFLHQLLAGSSSATTSTATTSQHETCPRRDIEDAPRELLAIARKAMQDSPADRYEDAGGFGEELRRFLAGQLVASHRYSFLVRLRRWLRRRLVVVALSALACLLAAIGAMAIRETIIARRTAEAALVQARARGEDLLVTQATALLEGNPTLAVATLREVPPASPWWTVVPFLLEDARGRGVAFAYDIHGMRAPVIELAPHADDHRVLASGDGSVHLYDLARHTDVELARGTTELRAEWADRRIVLVDAGRVTVRDPDGRSGTVATGGEVAHWDASADVVAFTDGRHIVHVIDVSEPSLVTTAVWSARPVSSIVVSEGGRWIAVLEEDTVTLLERTKSGWRSHDIAGHALTVAFDAEDRVVAFVRDDELVEIDLRVPSETPRRWKQTSALAAYRAGELYAVEVREKKLVRLLAQTGVEDLGPVGSTRRDPFPASAAGAVATLRDGRSIALATGSARLAIHTPEVVTDLVARSTSPYLVAVNPSHLLAWDLRPLLGSRTDAPIVTNLAFGHGHLVATAPSDDRGTAIMSYPSDGSPPRFAEAPSFTRITIVDDATIASPVQDAPYPIGSARPRITNLVALAPLDAQTWIAAARDGSVQRVDRATGEPRGTLASLPGVTSLRTGAGHVYAWSDTTLLRIAPNGATTTTSARDAIVAISERGDAAFVAGGNVFAWRRGEGPHLVASVPRDSRALCNGTSLIVVTNSGEILIHDPGSVAWRSLVVASTAYAFTPSCHRVAAVTGRRLLVIDPLSGRSRRIFEEIDVAVGGLALSRDGEQLAIGERDPATPGARGVLHLVQLGLDEPAPRWASTSTNARAPSSTSTEVSWELPAAE